MTYTEKDLIRDATVFGRRSGNKEITEEVYRNVWKAVLKWINSQFTIRKGACLSGVCTLTWTKTEKLNQERVLRPLFIPIESFVKANYLQWRGLTPQGEIVKSEDINFAKIAIRFSETLNKDTTFTCTRHMFAQIGKILSTGTEVAINLGVGTLIARDRKVDFQFSSEWARGIRVGNDSAATSATRLGPSVDTHRITSAGTTTTTTTEAQDLEGANVKIEIPKRIPDRRKPAVGFGSGGESRMRAGSGKQVSFSPRKENVNEQQFVTFSGAPVPRREPVAQPEHDKPPPLETTPQAERNTAAEDAQENPQNPKVHISKGSTRPTSSGRTAASSQAQDLRNQIAETEQRRATEKAQERRKEQEVSDNVARLNAQAMQTRVKLKQNKQDHAAYLKTQISEKRDKEKDVRRDVVVLDAPLMPAERRQKSEVDLLMRKGQYRMELEDQIWEKQFCKYMDAEQERLEEDSNRRHVELGFIASRAAKQEQKQQGHSGNIQSNSGNIQSHSGNIQSHSGSELGDAWPEDNSEY